MTKKRTQKPYWEMNTQELAEATAEFDEEFVMDKFGPLTPEMQARWEAAKRKPGRPKKERDIQMISISVHRELLARADALAKKMGITRAGLVARGLKAVLAAQGEL
jgi:hypothetical protein